MTSLFHHFGKRGPIVAEIYQPVAKIMVLAMTQIAASFINHSTIDYNPISTLAHYIFSINGYYFDEGWKNG